MQLFVKLTKCKSQKTTHKLTQRVRPGRTLTSWVSSRPLRPRPWPSTHFLTPSRQGRMIKDAEKTHTQLPRYLWVSFSHKAKPAAKALHKALYYYYSFPSFLPCYAPKPLEAFFCRAFFYFIKISVCMFRKMFSNFETLQLIKKSLIIMSHCFMKQF